MTEPSAQVIALGAAPIVAAIVSGSLGCAVFVFLWRTRREAYLGWWAAAWACWVMRFLWLLASPALSLRPPTWVLAVLLFRETFVLIGAWSLRGARVAPWWFPAAIVDAVISAAVGEAGPWRIAWLFEHSALFALPWLLAASAFRARVSPALRERWLVIGGFAAQAIATATLPLLLLRGASPTQWGFLVAEALQLTISAGMIITAYREFGDADVESQRRLSDAMAHVIAGYMPICEQCHSLRRDDGSWTPIAQYLQDQTAARLSHGICPSCVNTHFADFAPARPLWNA